MERYWAERKSDWFHGGYVWVHELMERYYLWEVEPMCDSYNKFTRSCDEWEIMIKRSYIEPNGKRIATCHETFAEAKKLSKEDAMKLYELVMSNKHSLPELKELFEDTQYTADAIRLMP